MDCNGLNLSIIFNPLKYFCKPNTNLLCDFFIKPPTCVNILTSLLSNNSRHTFTTTLLSSSNPYLSFNNLTAILQNSSYVYGGSAKAKNLLWNGLLNLSKLFEVANTLRFLSSKFIFTCFVVYITLPVSSNSSKQACSFLFNLSTSSYAYDFSIPVLVQEVKQPFAGRVSSTKTISIFYCPNIIFLVLFALNLRILQ